MAIRESPRYSICYAGLSSTFLCKPSRTAPKIFDISRERIQTITKGGKSTWGQDDASQRTEEGCVQVMFATLMSVSLVLPITLLLPKSSLLNWGNRLIHITAYYQVSQGLLSLTLSPQDDR